MVENKSAKRVWFITDTHLGVRNNSNEWIDSIREYFTTSGVKPAMR